MSGRSKRDLVEEAVQATKRNRFKAYDIDQPLIGSSPLSHAFFSSANCLRRIAREQSRSRSGSHLHNHAAVILYVTAVESYLNEKLSLSESCLVGRGGPQELIDKLSELRNDSLSEKKVKDVFRIYTNGVIDFSAKAFVDFFPLISIRHSLVHYQHDFVPMNEWPTRIRTAVLRSKIAIERTSWTDMVGRSDFADWCNNVTKGLIVEFHRLTNSLSPFDSSYPEGFRWTND